MNVRILVAGMITTLSVLATAACREGLRPTGPVERR